MIDFEEAYIRVCNKHDAVRDENDALRASNARLREALERIANNYWTSSAAESMRTIARAALELEESK